MTIAARMVLPDVAVPVGGAGLAQRPDEYGWSLSSEFDGPTGLVIPQRKPLLRYV